MRIEHPTSTGSGGRRYRNLKQRQPSDTANDADYVQCYQCGWHVNSKEHPGGNSFDSTDALVKPTVIAIPSGTRTVYEYDDNIRQGCPFCKSPNYRGARRLREKRRRLQNR